MLATYCHRTATAARQRTAPTDDGELSAFKFVDLPDDEEVCKSAAAWAPYLAIKGKWRDLRFIIKSELYTPVLAQMKYPDILHQQWSNLALFIQAMAQIHEPMRIAELVKMGDQLLRQLRMTRTAEVNGISRTAMADKLRSTDAFDDFDRAEAELRAAAKKEKRRDTPGRRRARSAAKRGQLQCFARDEIGHVKADCPRLKSGNGNRGVQHQTK